MCIDGYVYVYAYTHICVDIEKWSRGKRCQGFRIHRLFRITSDRWLSVLPLPWLRNLSAIRDGFRGAKSSFELSSSSVKACCGLRRQKRRAGLKMVWNAL